MPDRISPRHPRFVEAVLLVMLMGVVFLSGVVVWAILTGDPEEERLQSNVETLLRETRASQQAGSCTNFRNQRALEEGLRDIARLNGLRIGDPRVVASEATAESCKAAGFPIGKDGLPDIPPAVPVTDAP